MFLCFASVCARLILTLVMVLTIFLSTIVIFQAIPFFFGMIIIEHIILKLQGKRGIRLNDGLMSLVNGLMMAMREYDFNLFIILLPNLFWTTVLITHTARDLFYIINELYISKFWIYYANMSGKHVDTWNFFFEHCPFL